MCINHRGRDIFVAQQFLHCADVVAILQEVGREAVAKGMECSSNQSLQSDRANSFFRFSALGAQGRISATDQPGH